MSDNRRVLMVVAQYPPVYGGAGTQSSMLARKLVELGWEVRVVTLDQYHTGSGMDGRVWVSRIWRWPPKNAVLRVGATIALSLGSVWSVITFRPNIIHVHGTYWWSLAPILIGKLRNSVTVVKTTREGEDDPRTVFTKKVLGIPVGGLYGLPLKLADAVVVLNRASKDSALEFGLGRRTSLIRNGVDSEAFHRTPERRARSRKKFNVDPELRIVCFVGYTVAHKGFFDLIEAIRGIDKNRFEFWVVGPSSGFYRELKQDATAALAELSATGVTVREFGLVAPQDMPEIYWATDVFALPSYAEGMPNSLAEALVAGCDLLATAIPGVSDLFSDSDDIELKFPGDVKGLASYLSSLINGAEQDTSSARNRLSARSIAIEYSSLYQRLRAEK